MNSAVSDNEFDSESLNTDTQKCANCGGNLCFDPTTQKLRCQHCGTEVDFFKDQNVAELDFSKVLDNTEKWEGTKVIHCQNCGAVMTVSDDDISLLCPYCKTSHVLQTEEIGGIKPNALYPFTVSQDNAVLGAKKWAKSKFFAPGAFKKNLNAKNLKGIYYPCWTFDSNTFTRYSGRVGYRRTRVVKTKNGMRTETYIVWRSISGEISIGFDDVSIIASSEATDRKYMGKIMNYPLPQIKVYEKKYLAGFYANHYDKDIKQSWTEAQAVMTDDIKRAIIKRHAADVVDYINTDTNYFGVTYKYVLLPVWTLTYPYKEKQYRVYVNGSTGKVTGQSPVSALKVLGVVGIVLSLCLILLFCYLCANKMIF